MYCVQQDSSSGWLQEFSYCNETEECLEDHWNYINRFCEGGQGWKRGRDLGIEFCGAEYTDINITFTSTENKTRVYEWYRGNKLGAGQFTNITVNAQMELARVIFESSMDGDIGIKEAPFYFEGRPITFDKGSGNNTLTIYNGKKTGDAYFDISFSGASTTLVGVGAGIAMIAAHF